MMQRISLAWKALGELGFRQMSRYALYRFRLRSGILRRQTIDDARFTELPEACFRITPLLELPERASLHAILGDSGCDVLLSEADEILTGRVRLFGADPVPLELESSLPKLHWTELEKEGIDSQEKDIKWTWEAGRFGWAIILGRAYRLTGDERYPEFFWNCLETFLDANPPYLGVHWVSAQEAALRLISIALAAQTFAGSTHSTPDRMDRLGRAIAAHAGRIPPSLAYAQSQNNNHLLSEAAVLYTAGLALGEHPLAAKWRKLGWRWFHDGIARQVAADGGYTQHSTNYHRLMLQLALWVAAISKSREMSFPERTNRHLAAATRWLLDLLDPETGDVPNLGPNDGAYILPLATGPFRDYRPVVQAAGEVFLKKACLPSGYWDEMGLWLNGRRAGEINVERAEGAGCVIRLEHSWAYLRATRFSSRPGHADQLHVDLWWRGVNLSLDPGSYLYTAPPPWDNALSRTYVHNTVTVDGLEQMSQAGRFLWLDWAQATRAVREIAPDGAWERLSAEHDGYRRLGVIHRRTLTAFQDGPWLVEDALLNRKQLSSPDDREFTVRLHWLVPDWSWGLMTSEGKVELLLESPAGTVKLSITSQPGQPLAKNPDICLVRAGELVSGEGAADPVLGWYSPTYGYKYPALSLSFSVRRCLPVLLTSEWCLPEKKG